MPGSALSSQSVPLNTLLGPLELSPEIMTILPEGDFSVKSRSPGHVCVMFVVSRTRPSFVPTPETVRFELSTAGGSARTTAVVLVKVLVVPFGARGSAVTSSDQLLSAPPSVLLLSAIVSVQTPLGFSPTKALSASSGTSVAAVVRFV